MPRHPGDGSGQREGDAGLPHTQIQALDAATAAALLALMPELGQVDRRQAAALAGVVPHPNRSGAAEAYRRARGGRPEVKRTLVPAALTASLHNPSLKDAYQRLRAAGKKPIVAIMRRLIVIANARLRDAYANHKESASN